MTKKKEKQNVKETNLPDKKACNATVWLKRLQNVYRKYRNAK